MFHLEQLYGDKRLMLVCFLNFLINLLTITTNAARVSGAETKRVATALSLYNVFQTSFRMLNLIYAPLMASIVDILAKSNQDQVSYSLVWFHYTASLVNTVSNVGRDLILIKLRFVVLAAAIGSFAGILMLPTFIEVYKLGIKAMEKFGSIPKIVLAFMKNPAYWVKLFKCLRGPNMGVNPLKLNDIPRSFLIFNVIGVSMWTIGVLSSTYASVLNQELVRTAVNLSGIVNGIGTIFLFVLVEPVSALIVDQAVNGMRKVDDVKVMVIWLGIGSVIGNLIGVLLLEPGARYILAISKLIGS